MTSNEVTHYLRLRWTACYMLFDDDRFLRAHSAFLNIADQIAEEINRGGAICDSAWLDAFNLSLAQKIEGLIDAFLCDNNSSRAEVETEIAEKSMWLAGKYECQRVALSEKGDVRGCAKPTTP